MSELSSQAAYLEKRRHPRRAVLGTLAVSDLRRQPLGRLSNLSRGGFMLISNQVLEAERRYDLIIEEAGGLIRLSARCVWCQQSSYSQEFGAGFEIEAVVGADRSRFEALVGG